MPDDAELLKAMYDRMCEHNDKVFIGDVMLSSTVCWWCQSVDLGEGSWRHADDCILVVVAGRLGLPSPNP